MIKTCQICNRQFQTNQPNQLVCSVDCRHKKRILYMRKRRGFPDTIICARCGSVISNHKTKRRKFCDSCRAIIKQQNLADLSSKPRNPQKQRDRQKRFYWRHRDECLAKNKIYAKDARPFIRIKDRERYRLNPLPKQIQARIHYHKFKHIINPKRYILCKLKKEELGLPFKPFCHTCGKSFIRQFPGQRYCSVDCYQKSPWFRLWLKIKSEFGY